MYWVIPPSDLNYKLNMSKYIYIYETLAKKKRSKQNALINVMIYIFVVCKNSKKVAHTC